MRTRIHQWAFIVVLSCAQAHAQTPQGYAWSYLPNISTNGNEAVTIAHDGTYLYAGGQLDRIGVSRWDGHEWIKIYQSVLGWVNALHYDGANVYAAGYRLASAGSDMNLLKWNGVNWRYLIGNNDYNYSGFTHQIHSLSHHGAKIYIGTYRVVYSWDGNVKESVFTSSLSSNMYYRALLHDGVYLYAGGRNADFTVSERCLVRWDGSQLASMGVSGAGVYALLLKNGILYAGGQYTNAGNSEISNIAQWDGGNWWPLGEGVNGSVKALAHDGTYLYAGGGFTEAGTQNAKYVAMWDGEQWHPMDTGLSEPVESLALNGNTLYASGGFGVAQWSRTEHPVIFDLGGKGLLLGGGGLEQTVLHRTEAEPPVIEPIDGWLFSGWNRSLIVTNEATIRAQYLARIPSGTFAMGDSYNEGIGNEIPVHSPYLNAYYIGETLVTKDQWDAVYAWATNHGYTFGSPGFGKAADHPVQQVNWYDVVKWCNAKSEMEGLPPAYYTSGDMTSENIYRTGTNDLSAEWVNWTAGYRLPTEAEWEKAAGGGADGLRFPWGNTINHDHANYRADNSTVEYDTSPYDTGTYHPLYAIPNAVAWPFTSPVDAFTPNGYGLRDMAGNLSEWCWDWHDYSYYSVSPDHNPRGPSTGTRRTVRGGGWNDTAYYCRVAYRSSGEHPDYTHYFIGFRLVRALPESPSRVELSFQYGRAADYAALPASQRAFIESTEWSLDGEEWHDFRPETLAGMMPLELPVGDYALHLRQTNTYWKYMATGETPDPTRTYPEFRFHEWPGLETFTVVSGQTAQVVVNLSLHYAWDPPASQFVSTDSAFLATTTGGEEPSTAALRKGEEVPDASGIDWEEQIASAVAEREVTVPINRVVGDMAKLKASGAIAPMATLRLRCGTRGGGSRWNVLINGWLASASLQLPADEIGDVTVEFPVEWLDFPPLAGVAEGVCPMPAQNSVVLLSSDGRAWDMLIEQAAIEFSVAPPILFCHGINSDSNSWNTMRAMVDEHLGLPHHAFTQPSLAAKNMGTIQANAQTIKHEIQAMQEMYGVKQVNIVGHSKGGLDSRHYTVDSQLYGEDVYQLIQIATPNSGSVNAQRGSIAFRGIAGVSDFLTNPTRLSGILAKVFQIRRGVRPGSTGGLTGFWHLTESYMKKYNEKHPPNPGVYHRVIAGEYRCPNTFGLLVQSQGMGMDMGNFYLDVKRKWIKASEEAGGLIDKYVRHYQGEDVVEQIHDPTDSEGSASGLVDVVIRGLLRPNDCWVTVESAHSLAAQGIQPYPESALVSSWTNHLAEHTTIERRIETFKIIKEDLAEPYSGDHASATRETNRAMRRTYLERAKKGGVLESAYVRRGGAVYADMLSEGEEKEYRFINDPGARVMNFRFVHETGTVSYAIWSPQGTVWTNSDAEGDVEFEVSEDVLETWISINQADVAGVWTAKVSGVAIPDESFLYLELLENGGEDIQMELSLVQETVPEGEPLVLHVELTDQGVAIAGSSVEGRMLIVGADDFPVNESFEALDNGVWPDEVAGDGVYSAALNPPYPAAYQIHVAAEKETSPSFMRSGYIMGNVAEAGTRFTAGHDDEALDLTGDGLFDELRLHFGVDVARSGTLWVAATMADPSGEWIADCQGSFSAEPGVTTLVFRVRGEDVHASRQNGPYRVLNARLSRQADTGDHVLLDEADELFQTEAYAFTDFQHPAIQRTSAATWDAVDADEDGAYGRLEVALDIETQPEMAGEFLWRAELTDATGRILAVVEGTVTLGDPGNPTAVFEIAGDVIGAAGVDGPYTIQKLELWRFAQLQEVFYDVGTSAAYSAADFAGYIPFEMPLPDIRVEHDADSFVLHWPSSTGIWYDVEYAPDPLAETWLPVTGALGIEATPPENTHELPWHGPSHHWYHYRVKPRRIP